MGAVFTAASGRATSVLRGLVQLRAPVLHIRGDSAALMIALDGARFAFGPVAMFDRVFQRHDSEPGLQVISPHGDWLFVAPIDASAVPMALGANGLPPSPAREGTTNGTTTTAGNWAVCLPRG